MAEAGRMGRKIPSPEAPGTTSALYNKQGNISYFAGRTGSTNMEYVAAMLVELTAVYRRSIDARVYPGEVVICDEEGELVRIPADRALSIVEDIRFLLSPILDRKV